MLKPGDKVTHEEVERIQLLSTEQIWQEIALLVQESGEVEDLKVGRMHAMLHTYYTHAHFYRYVPYCFEEIKPTICLFSHEGDHGYDD